jgi:CheY-like chemotaxis protein
VIANLLHNAAKYTEPGGAIELSAEAQAGMVSIRVKDNGIGIPPKMLDKIFEVFVQVDPTSDRSRGGLGLGLSLAKHLIEMHGGTIAVNSEGPSRGSEFSVTIPLAPKRESPKLEIAPPLERASAAPSLSIVLIEDNVDIRETLRDILELRGHKVSVARDGQEGVKRVLVDRPQVALVDIGLPGFDGYQVASAIRKSELGQEVRLVALTGYGAADDRRRALAAGFDEHLVKPLSPEVLEPILARLCSPAPVLHPPTNIGTQIDANADSL